MNRDDIARGAEMLGMPIEELIEQVIAALREAADQVGVRGQPAA